MTEAEKQRLHDLILRDLWGADIRNVAIIADMIVAVIDEYDRICHERT